MAMTEHICSQSRASGRRYFAVFVSAYFKAFSVHISQVRWSMCVNSRGVYTSKTLPFYHFGDQLLDNRLSNLDAISRAVSHNTGQPLYSKVVGGACSKIVRMA